MILSKNDIYNWSEDVSGELLDLTPAKLADSELLSVSIEAYKLIYLHGAQRRVVYL